MKYELKKDSVWLGMGMGLVIPIVVYAVLRILYELMDTLGVFSDIGFAEDFRVRTLILISICTNLLVMQFFRKSYYRHETVRGMLIASMILVVIWFWKFGFKILQD